MLYIDHIFTVTHTYIYGIFHFSLINKAQSEIGRSERERERDLLKCYKRNIEVKNKKTIRKS